METLQYPPARVEIASHQRKVFSREQANALEIETFQLREL